MALGHTPRITLEEYEEIIQLPENQDRKLELLDGEIIEKMPTPLHSLILRRLLRALEAFLLGHPLGELFIETRQRLPNDPAFGLIPDLAFVRAEQVPLMDWKRPLPFVPDLCIEIQSPEQSEKMLIEKATHFLAHGGRMVWIIYPDKGIVEWLTPSERRLLVGDDVIAGGEVLPGFAMTVAALLEGL